jgi:Tol biopolymer transport system component
MLNCELAQQILCEQGGLGKRLRAELHALRCGPCRGAARMRREIARHLRAVAPEPPPPALVAAWRSAMPEAVAIAARPRPAWRMMAAAALLLGLGWLALRHPAVAPKPGGAPCALRTGVSVLVDPKVADDVEWLGFGWWPDGRSVIYTTASEDSGRARRLWRQDLATGERRVLAEESGEQFIASPAVSPDGSRLAYSDGRYQKLVDLKTGQVRVLPKSFGAHEVSWSPDGKWLAFERSQGNDADGSWVFEERGLWVMAASGGAPVKIVDFPEGMHQASMWTPRWSPDGKWIAYVWQTEERAGDGTELFAYDSEIRLVRPDGSEPRTVVSVRRAHGDGAHFLGLQCWSPDSKRLVFQWTEAVGEAVAHWSAEAKSYLIPDASYVPRGVVALDLDTGALTEAAPVAMFPRGSASSWNGAWSPRRQTIVFAAPSSMELGNYRSDIYASQPDTGATVPLVIAEEGTSVSHPLWSPDGQALLYTRAVREGQRPGRPVKERELWLVRLRVEE